MSLNPVEPRPDTDATPNGPDISAPESAAPQNDDETLDARELLTRAEQLSRRNSFRIGLTVGVVVTVAAALLIIQNGDSARLHWLGFSFNAPLWIFLGLTLAAGMVLGRVVPYAVRRGRQRTRQRRAALEQARDALATKG